MSQNKSNGDEAANDFKDHVKLNLVLKKIANPGNDRGVYFYGTDLSDGESTEFSDEGGWIALNLDKFKIGDTLIKPIGKYNIFIKRKGKRFSIPFILDGKCYIDK